MNRRCFYLSAESVSVVSVIRGLPRPGKKFGKLKKYTVHNFQNAHQARTGRNMVKSSSPNAPSTWLIFLRPRTHAFPQTCHHSASSFLAVRIICALSQCFVQKATRRMEKSVNTHNRLRYFLTNKIFLLQAMYKYACMIFMVKCVTIIRFSLILQSFVGKAWFLLFYHPLKLYVKLYSTGTVFFHCCIICWGLD